MDEVGSKPQRFFLPWKRRLNGGLLLMVLLLGTMGFYILYPLLLILINSFNVASIADPPVYSLEAWRVAFSDADLWVSLWNTIKIAAVYQTIAFPIGIIIAWLLARTNMPFARGFEFMFWVSFLLPNLATTFGWIMLLDPSTGLINKWLKELPLLNGLSFDIYSFWGIIWAHLMANGISIKVMLLTPAFRRMDASLEEASRMMGGNTLITMLRITIPVMTPALVVVFLLSLIRMFSTFETELLLGAPWGFYVYSTKIVDLAKQDPPLLNQAAALGSITLLFLAVFIPLQRWLIARRQFTTVTSQFKPKLVDLGPWKIAATALVFLVTCLLVIIPSLSVLGSTFMVHFGFFNLPDTWTLEYWQLGLNDQGLLRAFTNTMIIAGAAALVGPFLFSLVAYVLVRTRLPGRSLLDSLCWIPSAIPGILAGLGLLWMFLGTPFFRPFYGSLFLLTLATVLGGVTLATQVLKSNFIQLGNELEEASRMSGAGFWRTYFKVVLPLMAQTMVLIGVLKFMFAAQHTSSIILLATSHTWTLSLLTLEQISYGYYEQASITISLIIVLTLGLAIVARSFGLKVGVRAD